MNLMWDKSLETGIDIIDTQHKELLNHLNNFLTAMKDGRGKKEIEKTLDFLEDYVIKHFKDEEELQKRYGYTKANEQSTQHEYFRNELKGLRGSFNKSGESALLALNVQGKVVNWVKNHIMTLDKDLGEFITEKSK